MPSEPNLFFPPFRLDPANAQLRQGDQEITLRPKTFDVLRYLVDHHGQLVTKATLLDAVWAGAIVSDSMPAVCVKELRKALGDDAKKPRFIETVQRRGYRFIAQVTTERREEPVREAPNQPKGPTPIVVGRERELAQLQSWYVQALEGQRRVVFVSGEAGIGKSTFTQAFVDSITQQGAVRVGRGQCVEQFGTGEPYMPVLEALSRLSGERVVELLQKFAPMWLAQMPGLLTLEERTQLHIEIQGVTQQRMLREITEALDALAVELPLVLLLEDLHWSDFSTLELISAIARRREPARLLIIGTYRPVEMLTNDHPLLTMKEELELHRYCDELRLRLLNKEEVAGYLAKRLPHNGSRQLGRLGAIVHQRTDGNPLFMVNVVDYLVDAGLLVSSREAGAAESADTLHAELHNTPRSIRRMIERNLDRLQPDEQAVLEGASVAGAEFSAASVAAAVERPQTEVEACCTRLSRHEQFVARQGPVTWPDGTVAASFRFQHALYQEVLYGRLPEGHRLQLHGRIAAREEAGYGERADEVANELAHHYSLANVKNKAIQYFRIAGERAVTRGAMVEAEEHYRCALKLVSELPEDTNRDRQELALQMALGDALWSSRSWAHSETKQAYTRALQLSEKLGETTKLVGVLKGLAVSALGSAQFKLARELAERMLAAAERSGNRAALCSANSLLGQSLIWRAQYVDAQKHLELASIYYDGADRGELGLMGIDALALAAIATLLLGFPGRARQLMDTASRNAEGCNDPFWIGLVHVWGVFLCCQLRDSGAAIDHAEALSRLAATQPVWTGLADVYMGRALMLQGHWEEGVGCLRKATAFHKANGLFAELMRVKLDEADFFANQGQIDAALALIESALSDADELAQIRPPALRRRAELLAQSNASAPEIERAYRAAIESGRSQGAKFYELQATTSFARWLKSRGSEAEAHLMLAEIYNWFTEGFDTVALKEAKALIDELSR
jgi:DNA-binding winged helix-turn-helix (wHTH) protein/tetratricopeptide (TPR) repeat protein